MDLWTCRCSAMLPWPKPVQRKEEPEGKGYQRRICLDGSPRETRRQMGDCAHLKHQNEMNRGKGAPAGESLRPTEAKMATSDAVQGRVPRRWLRDSADRGRARHGNFRR